MINFESLEAESSFLQGIQIKFVHESHRVKVKFTAAKKHTIPYFHNVQRQSANCSSIEDRAVKFACSMGFVATADRIV